MANPYFSKRRCAELSLVDYIEGKMNDSWSNPKIPVMKSFAKVYTVSAPVICVRMLQVGNSRLEIGDNQLKQDYTFIVDIFAKSDGQRIDLADFIVQVVKEGCTLYTYSHNATSKEVLDKTASGRLTLGAFINDNKVEFSYDVAEQDKYRHSITFTMR